MDPTRAFADRVVADLAGAFTAVVAAIGDRLGLWRDLARAGPATAGALARRTGLAERALRDWLAAMTAAGYLACDPASGEYGLTAFHAAVLADEGGPWFLAGAHEATLGLIDPVERVIAAFRTGAGVSRTRYPAQVFGGLERVRMPWYAHALVARWIPAIRGAVEALERGIAVADLHCGSGDAALAIAHAFPASHVTGFDIYGANVARARERAAREGLAERCTFVQRDAAAELPRASFDLVTMFDALYAAVDPGALLAAARAALRPTGVALCLELSSAGSASPALDALRHGLGVLFRNPIALAHGAAATHSAGLEPLELEGLATDAGFARITQHALGGPIHTLFELRP